ncbi:hypothetical protein KR084_010352, partial [Drosophila pseudotakahashii]
MESRDRKIARLVMDSIDAMGGSASKEVILRTVSTATSTRVIRLVDKVDEIMDYFMERGLIRKRNGEYHI